MGAAPREQIQRKERMGSTPTQQFIRSAARTAATKAEPMVPTKTDWEALDQAVLGNGAPEH
eukprot:9466339-Pyramimonas_sp.AAC.1